MEEETLEGRLQASFPNHKTSKKLIPTADSLQAVLEQALQTSDTNLIESVISTTDETIIQNTIKRLPASSLVPLVDTLTIKFEENPRRAPHLLFWIKTIIIEHAAYFSTNPNTLSKLHRVTEMRLGSFKKLLRLSGRLDLALAQVSKRKPGTLPEEYLKETEDQGEEDQGEEDQGEEDQGEEDQGEEDQGEEDQGENQTETNEEDVDMEDNSEELDGQDEDQQD